MNLSLGHGEDWNNTTAFDDRTQDQLFQIEDGSWWFQYRAEVIVTLMCRYFDKYVQTEDIGGGNGYTTSAAAENGFWMQLLEPSERACKNAELRGINALCGVLSEDYPDDGAYNQVLLLDVLEHIENDEGFLSLLHRKMAWGGILLITVPAFQCLWSSEDDAAGHFRRYRKRKLMKLLMDNGFDILYCNYFMCFLFLPVFILRAGFERVGLLKRHEQRSEEEKRKIMENQFKTKNRLVSRVLHFFEQAEKRC